MTCISTALRAATLLISFTAIALGGPPTAQANPPGWQDKYVHPAKPVTTPERQMAFVCANFDYYGTRRDVVKGMSEDLLSWGLTDEEAGRIVATAAAVKCPEHMRGLQGVVGTPRSRR
ncbi:hypothetical protein [Mycobacterium sp. P7213]|uniref:hypothetical protein n=1 Tax=Mycobacterium sp. P7213 TaxID=2478465 RepID=UPI000F62F7DB|nr:hypothetical protein [Mycobacterium sp. P7213]